MTHQLELNLQQPKAPGRNRPVLERLLEIIRRNGCNTSRDDHKGRVMFRPNLARAKGLYMDHCSQLACLNRPAGLYTSGYSERKAA